MADKQLTHWSTKTRQGTTRFDGSHDRGFPEFRYANDLYVHMYVKVTVYLQVGNFLQIWIFRPK